jgi:FixJ family two-component response regulator
MPTVFVISNDWTLRATVRAELRHLGIEALGMESVDDLARAVAQGKTPSAVVLDAAGGGAELSAASTQAALANLAKRVPLVVVASRVESALPLEDVAELLYRPVRVGDIVARVQKLLAGQAA